MRLLLAVIFLSGCATLAEKPGSGELTLLNTSDQKFKNVDSTAHSGIATYRHAANSQKVEWLGCHPTKASKRSILVMHSEMAAFDAKDFCNNWIAQAFLSNGFNVVAINRPGYGRSTGKKDLAGPNSMAALAAGLKALKKKHPELAAPEGFWGYSLGATAAALFAKKTVNKPKYLILGSGAYDFEGTLSDTKDTKLKEDLNQLMQTESDLGFEIRSVAYDLADLPKRIALYHGTNDKTIKPQQTQDFYDSLQSDEYKVTLQFIKGVEHAIPENIHRKILNVLILSTKK